MGRAGTIARRTFLIGLAAAAGGLAVGYYYYRRPYPNPLHGVLDEGEATFNPYVIIAANGDVTIIVPRAEMGQGVTTTLAALVAEELDVDLAGVNVIHGPASPAYYNEAMLREGAPAPTFDHSMMTEAMRGAFSVAAKFLALQVTGGSSTTNDAFDKMRHAGATAREALKAAAAERLGVDAATLRTENGRVTDPASGTSLGYGELAAQAAALDVPASVPLRPKSMWRLLGKSQPRTDMRAKVTGAPIFGVDVALPDMLHATVRMNPRLMAPLVSLDAAAAEKMPGVVKVVKIDTQTGSGFGVIADNTWRAFQAADAVNAQWGAAPYPEDTAGIFKVLEDAFVTGDASALRDDGDVEQAFADAPADSVIEAEYRVPYLAHATMEPMNATARFRNGELDVWVPNQAPTILQSVCAGVAGIETEKCRVHTTYLGGGFGRRAEVDAAVYASLLAMETDGRPVKATWTREEDMTHDAYRPAAIGRYRARLGGDGAPVALDAAVASPSIVRSMLARTFPGMSPFGPDKTITEGAFDQPYAIPDYRVAGIEADIKIPVGFWRSVGNSFNAFMHESFIDEIAHARGTDPLALRRALMAPHPTAIGVLDRLAEMSGWSAPRETGTARGLAFTLSFGTWVGQVVEVRQSDAGIRIANVWCVADCGAVLDPAIFSAQMMSGIVFGLSSALGQEITFAGGAAEQTNFHDYDAMRINQCPNIEVAILENSGHMGGAGEPGTPPSIPALANAVFALTGKRIRTMPLSKEVTFA